MHPRRPGKLFHMGLKKKPAHMTLHRPISGPNVGPHGQKWHWCPTSSSAPLRCGGGLPRRFRRHPLTVTGAPPAAVTRAATRQPRGRRRRLWRLVARGGGGGGVRQYRRPRHLAPAGRRGRRLLDGGHRGLPGLSRVQQRPSTFPACVASRPLPVLSTWAARTTQ